MIAALELHGIVKRFKSLVAVDKISFAVQPGEICGFIGPNGAGKTTTMRICSTLELPDRGDVRVGGLSVLTEPREARALLGFMPDAYGVYANTTVLDYLDFFGRAYGLRGERRRATIAQVMEFTSLEPLASKEMRALSKGMKQRLCLAKTLLHDPAVLILDEPASGLDPRARVELRELLLALAAGGKAILISSHILSELAEMCHTLVVIERGQIRGTGTLGAIRRQLAPHAQVRLRTLEPLERAERALAEQPGVGAVRRDGDALVFDHQGGQDDLARLLEALVQAGLRPVEFALRESDLEDIFLSLTEGQVQ